MAATQFPTILNNFVSALGASYTLGAGVITLTTGDGARLSAKIAAEGQSAISSTHKIRFTVGTSLLLNFVFEATGLTGDVLAGSVVEGTDHAFPIGTTCGNLQTSGHINKITAAIGNLETIVYGVTNVRTSAPPAGMTVPVGGLVNLALGSSDETSGIADQTTALQAIHDLNLASGGRLRVVYDDAYPVSGLTINSRSLLAGTPGAGLKRITGTHAPLLRNTTLTAGVVTIDNVPSSGGGTATWGSYGNTDITVEDLILNGNAGNTPAPLVGGAFDHRPHGVQFWGVQRLHVNRVVMWDSPRFGAWLKNCQFVRSYDCIVEVPTTSATPDSRDGIDITVSDDVLIKGWRIKANDDAIAVAGNGGGNGSITASLFVWIGPNYYAGPSGQVTLEDIVFNASCRGIDILSTDQFIRSVTIRNVKGTCYDYPLHFWAFAPTGTRTGPGNIGDVTIDGFNVVPLGSVQTDGWNALGANFRSLVAKGVRYAPDANNLFPYFQIASGVTYNQLRVEYDSEDLDSANRARQVILDAGTGDSVVVDVNVTRPGLSAVSYPAYKKTGGGINSVLVSGRMDRVLHMAEIAGGATVPAVQLRGLHSNAGGGGSLNVASGLTVSNLGRGGLLTVTPSDGAGTISHDIGAGTYTEASVSLATSLAAFYKLGEAAGAARVASVGGLSLTESPSGTVGTGTLLGATVANFAGAGTDAETTTFLTHAFNGVFQPAVGQAFWLSCEFKITTLPGAGGGRLVGFRTASNFVFQLSVISTGALRFAHYDGSGSVVQGTNFQFAEWGTLLTTGVTHTVVCGWDTANVWISLDGGAKVTVADTISTGQVASAAFNVGGLTGGIEVFNGLLGRVAFGKGYTPTSGDLTTIYNGGADYTYGF